jgi:glycine betaine transporter
MESHGQGRFRKEITLLDMTLVGIGAIVGSGWLFASGKVASIARSAGSISLAFSRYGGVRLGGLNELEMSTFKWVSIVLCTLITSGVFFTAPEPLSHFPTVPLPFSGAEAGASKDVTAALARSYPHWGFLALAIIGSLGAMVTGYGHYNRGWPLKPRIFHLAL